MKTGWQTFAENPPPIGDRILVYFYDGHEGVEEEWTYWISECEWLGDIIKPLYFAPSERALLWRPMPQKPQLHVVERALQFPVTNVATMF